MNKGEWKDASRMLRGTLGFFIGTGIWALVLYFTFPLFNFEKTSHIIIGVFYYLVIAYLFVQLPRWFLRLFGVEPSQTTKEFDVNDYIP